MLKIQPKTIFTGKNTVYLPTCHSTNDKAIEIIQNGKANEGTIVITEHQTRGKGQRGNIWEAASGKNLTFSLILEPDFLDARYNFRLNVAISLALNESLNEFLPGELKIKWPNDILYRSSKLGGLLIENIIVGQKITYSVVGIGLNINQLTFEYPNAISLKSILKKSINRRAILESVLEKIERNYLALKEGRILEQELAYTQNLYLLNTPTFFMKNGLRFEGEILGINVDGQLLMNTNEGQQLFGLKEFQYIF